MSSDVDVCLLVGATVFSVASLLCGIAPDDFGAGNRTGTTKAPVERSCSPGGHGDNLGRLQRGGACGLRSEHW